MCFLSLFTRAWKGEDEFRPHPFGANYRNIFFMGIDDFLRDGKTKACSFLILSTRKIGLIKTIPNLFETIFRNADSMIFDSDKCLIILYTHRNTDGRVVRTELDCIINQIMSTCWILSTSASTMISFMAKSSVRLIFFLVQVPSKLSTVFLIIWLMSNEVIVRRAPFRSKLFNVSRLFVSL